PTFGNHAKNVPVELSAGENPVAASALTSIIFRVEPVQHFVHSLEIRAPKSASVFVFTPVGVKYGRMPASCTGVAAGFPRTVFWGVKSAVAASCPGARKPLPGTLLA